MSKCIENDSHEVQSTYTQWGKELKFKGILIESEFLLLNNTFLIVINFLHNLISGYSGKSFIIMSHHLNNYSIYHFQEANIQTRRTRAFGAAYGGKIFLAGGYLENYLCSVEVEYSVEI